MGNITFSLNVQVIEPRTAGRAPFLDAAVHVWEDNVHLTTVKIADIVYFTWPEHANINNVEDFALAASRVLARCLSAGQMEAIDNGSLHTRDSFRTDVVQ